MLPRALASVLRAGETRTLLQHRRQAHRNFHPALGFSVSDLKRLDLCPHRVVSIQVVFLPIQPVYEIHFFLCRSPHRKHF